MSKVLLLAKQTAWCDRVAEFVTEAFGYEATVRQGRVGEPLPPEVLGWTGQIIISYLSPWILPVKVLASATQYAINFHPGSPAYPGAGCYNFALYEQATRYGVTCHHMARVVDSGPIIATRYFQIPAASSVFQLKELSMAELWELFLEIMPAVRAGNPLPFSIEKWTRKHLTRKDLDELCEVDISESQEEIDLKVRATYFPGAPGPFLMLGEHRFEYVPKKG